MTKITKGSTYLPVVSRRRAGHLAQSIIIPLLRDDPIDSRLDTASSGQSLNGYPRPVRTVKAASSAVLWWRVAGPLFGGSQDGGDVEGSLWVSQLGMGSAACRLW